MFQRVEPQHAGPGALGILIPQGARTLVIVRPRALEWDLLPARWDGVASHAPQLCLFSRDDAALVARRFIKAAEQGIAPVESFGNAERNCVQLWLRADEFLWIVCKRVQGNAYQPMIFMSMEAATRAAEAVDAIFRPETVQQYYFNTQNCGRTAEPEA
jgi:hypothetical protein